MSASRWGWTSALLLAACGSGTGSDGGSSATGSGGSTSAATSTSAADTMADEGTATDSTGSTSAASTSGDSTDGTGTTGEDLCPAPERVTADFSVSPDQDVDADCTVTALGGDPGRTSIDLDCAGEAVTLTVTILPDGAVPEVEVDQVVHLAYVTDPIFWVNRWVALHTTGGESDWLLLGGVSGSVLDPPGSSLDALFGGTPTVTEVSGECAAVEGPCGQIERLALDFGLDDDDDVRVFDQGTGVADVLAYGYSFTVAEAIDNLQPVRCADLPPSWFQFVAVWFPSD